MAVFAPELEDGFEPGMGFEDLVRIATERNYFATDEHSTEDVIHQRLEAHRSRHARHEVRLADGSWVSFQSYAAPGGGTILLRLDITEKKEAAAALEHAKEDTERLLLKVLPSQIVTRMQQGEATIADRFDEATVLFSDLVGFTKLSARLSPKQLVDNLNNLFSRFDDLADRLCVEKVKTIGDAYVAVAGVPEARPDHAAAMADMALGMIEAVDEFNAVMHPKFQLRVGLQTGPVAAGIIGKHRFLYDIWGDTMNMASRFESYSEPGRIHVSAEVARILEPDFDLESRGIMNIRGKGAVPTYFLNGRK